MLQILLLLAIVLFAYVVFIDHKTEHFETQTQENLDIAEQAALEISKIKTKIETTYKTILETQKEIGPAEMNNHTATFKTFLQGMKKDYQKAELAMLRAEVASPRSGPTIQARQDMLYMKQLIEKLNIAL